MKRIKLLLILAAMPDEAFNWLLMSLAGIPSRPRIWPDSLGGFQFDSRDSIESAQKEAKRLMDEASK